MSIEFDTSLLFAFFIVKNAYEAIFRGTQYTYFLVQNTLNLFKFIEQVKC